jgi:F420-dependent oxidoreductase-like protein
MRIGMPLPYRRGVREAARHVAELERAGLDVVWVAEAYGFDAPSQLGYLAAATRRVQLGFGILPIYSRTPALIAQTAAGLDLVSEGRAILGLGASGPQVIEGWHGVPYDRPLERTREIVQICRRIWRRQVLEHHGACYDLPLPAERAATGLGKPLKMLTHPVRDRIPIYLAALGPANVAMAAELGDGWLPLFYIPEQADRLWGESLRRGLAKRSPDLGPLEIVAGGPLAIGEGVQEAREQLRAELALYVGGMGARGKNFYNDLFRRYGYAREAEQVQELYLGGRKRDAAAAIPAALLGLLSLTGSADQVKDRVAAHKRSGITLLNVTPFGPDPARLIATVKEWAESA